MTDSSVGAREAHSLLTPMAAKPAGQLSTAGLKRISQAQYRTRHYFPRGRADFEPQVDSVLLPAAGLRFGSGVSFVSVDQTGYAAEEFWQFDQSQA